MAHRGNELRLRPGGFLGLAERIAHRFFGLGDIRQVNRHRSDLGNPALAVEDRKL